MYVEIKGSRRDALIRLCCVGSVSIRKAQREVITALGKSSLLRDKDQGISINDCREWS